MTKGRIQLLPGAVPIVALLVLASFINYIDRGNLAIAAPMLKDDLGISATQLGFLLSSFFWTYAIFQLVFGWLADRFNVSWLLALGFFLWSGATAATGLVGSLTALFVMRMTLGIGESAAYPCFSKILVRICPEERRGFANALIAAATSGGSAFGLLGGGMLMARTGWRPFFIGFGLISLLWLIPWLRWMPSSQAHPPVESKMAAPGILELFTDKSVLGTCVGLFSLDYISYFLITWLPFYLVRERHFSMNVMAETGGVVYVVAGASSTLSGWLSDRWIAGGGTPTLVRKTFMAVGLTGAGLFLVACVVGGKGSVMILLLLASVAYGMCASNIWSITQTLAGPAAVGKWTGLQNSLGNLAGVVAPALTGIVVDRTGQFFWAFAATAVVGVIGAASWIFVVGPVKPIIWRTEAGVLP